MAQEIVRFRFTYVPTADNRLDCLTLAYLQATAPRLSVLRERVWLALSAFWWPRAVWVTRGKREEVIAAVYDAGRLLRQHRQFLQALCGLAPKQAALGLHLGEPYLDRDLKLPGVLPKQPQRFQIAAEEAEGSQYGRLATHFNHLTRGERFLPIMEALRAFWYPLACRYVGMRPQELQAVVRAALAFLELQEGYLLATYHREGRPQPKLPWVTVQPQSWPLLEEVERAREAGESDGLAGYGNS